MIYNLITILHVFLSLSIVLLVLMQRGKGADAGAGFGAGASGTVFGARGSATFFSKLTAVLATMFFMTSISLAWFTTRPLVDRPSSIVDKVQTPLEQSPAPVGLDPDAVPTLADPATSGGADTPPPVEK